jgi:hypothetical protein
VASRPQGFPTLPPGAAFRVPAVGDDCLKGLDVEAVQLVGGVAVATSWAIR